MTLTSVLAKSTRDRWRGMAIGSGAMGVMLLLGMSLYREFDLSVYSDLPEAVRAVMNIPDGTDVAGIAYGAIYSTYGALTLAGLAIAIGAASIAGEERDGTLGLLLASPKSRSHVLLSKAGALFILLGLGSLVLWASGRISPQILDVAVGGTHVEALVFHMFVNACFYGMLATAVGAWTGKTGLASGVATGVMVISLFAAGIFPVVGWGAAAKAFPWYYYDGAAPVNNGVAWGHIALLAIITGALLAAAVVGLNRRDLRGQTVGVTLVDRLRAHPLTKQLTDRLAGSTRVSRIWIKTASEHQGLTLVVAAVMFGLMGVAMGPMYNLIDADLLDFSDQLPEGLMALLGGGNGDMSTPVGFLRGETFGLMAPIAVLIVGIVIGSRALAGEEARRTMGLLLANPVTRSSVVLEKAAAMALLVATVGFATFAGVTIGSLLGGLGIAVGNIAAISTLATLIGLVFGGLALALGAATGRVKLASFGAVGVALVTFVAYAILPLNHATAWMAELTPFHYYASRDPLQNGMDWGHAGVLAVVALGLLVASTVLFQRRDLREGA